MNFILNNHNSEWIATYADGAYIHINGRKCIDTSLGNGTHILGHKKSLNIFGGTLYGLKSFNENRYGSLLRKYTGFNSFVLCNTGAEATMRTARIARAFTGRDRIGIFEGGWHGCSDTWLDCRGIPKNMQQLIVRLPYDIDALQMIRDDNFALVLIEPVQGSLPRNNVDFLKLIQIECRNKGTLFGFDEVVTGFRLARGGGSEYFNIMSDIVAYGKIAGGGLPVGIVGGRDDVMAVCKEDVRMGGTFSGNPAVLQTGSDTLEQLDNNVYNHINRLGERIRTEIKLSICGVNSINRVLFTDRPIINRKERDKYEDQKKKKEFRKRVFDKGIYVGRNGIQFLSTKHTDKDVTKIIDVFNNVGGKL